MRPTSSSRPLAAALWPRCSCAGWRARRSFLTALGTGPGRRARGRRAARARRDRSRAAHGRVPSGARSRSSTTTPSARSPCSASGSCPCALDPLPWETLGELDAIYLTGGDAGAVRAARAARVLVATPRALGAIAESGVTLDVLVGSAHDPGEVYEPGMLASEPRVIVRTSGGEGGSWEARVAAPGEPPLPWLPGATPGSTASLPARPAPRLAPPASLPARPAPRLAPPASRRRAVRPSRGRAARLRRAAARHLGRDAAARPQGRRVRLRRLPSRPRSPTASAPA